MTARQVTLETRPPARRIGGSAVGGARAHCHCHCALHGKLDPGSRGPTRDATGATRWVGPSRPSVPGQEVRIRAECAWFLSARLQTSLPIRWTLATHPPLAHPTPHFQLPASVVCVERRREASETNTFNQSRLGLLSFDRSPNVMETNIASAQEILNGAGPGAGAGDDVLRNVPHSAPIAASQVANDLKDPILPSTTSLPPPPSSSSSSSRIQLIDEEQKFTPSMGKALDQWQLADAGFGYDLCAVLGSQSTGKSTLLNKLFGTSFDVMDETRRQQTTKGIWMCRGQNMNLLVMDVEGTDGRERGEDQDFERKSALFSMASAECLIVNMWEHQVGLYQGANMGLLKTVFEVNLGLFQAGKAKSGGSSRGQDKTLLCFVIRDHIGATPLENLKNTLMADLVRIWDSLSKPQGLEQSTIDMFFDFTFVTLPHKLLQPKEFDTQVDELRKRFADKSHPGFVFRPEYHKRIPADGLPHYLESIWEQVQSNKDLDLPTQQELLAQFRCDEIANAAFVQFATEVKVFRRPIEQGDVVDSLGAMMGQHRGTALEQFDKAASRYHAEVYKRKRLDLLEKLNSTLSPFFLGQLKNLHKAVLANFKASVTEKLRGDGYDFASVVSAERTKALGAFEAGAALIRLADTDWTSEDEFEQLKQDVGDIADQCRAEETKKMVLQIERALKKAIAEPTELALAKPQPEMWDRILKAFKTALQSAETAYLSKARSFNCTEEENERALRSLRRRSWLAMRAKIDEQTADGVLINKLRDAFEERFRYDDEGVPRVWRPDDDIDGIFRKARDETLALIPLYSRISPVDAAHSVSLPSTADDEDSAQAVARGEEEEFDFDASLVVFSETRKSDLAARFRKESDAYYVEAKRSMVSSIAQIPVWMYGVIAVLGWNEFIAVIKSPVYFTMLLLMAGTAYVIWYLGMTGPVLSLSKSMARETHKVIDGKLREHFNQPVPVPNALRDERPASTSTTRPRPAAASAAQEEIELKERTSS